MTAPTITLKIHLQPRASYNEIAGLLGEALKVRVTAPPVGGKANQALRRFIAKQLSLPRSNVQIIHGHNSREKLLLISGISHEEAQRVLGFTLPTV